MIQDHVRHLHHVIDDTSMTARFAIMACAIVAVPLLGTGVRTVGQTLGLGVFTLPLLALAHIPAVIALIAVWSLGCDICR